MTLKFLCGSVKKQNNNIQLREIKYHQNLHETHLDINKKPQGTATLRDKSIKGLEFFHYRTVSHVEREYFFWQKACQTKCIGPMTVNLLYN